MKIRELNAGRMAVLCIGILFVAGLALWALEAAIGSGLQTVLHECSAETNCTPVTYEWDSRPVVDAIKVWGRIAVLIATPASILALLWIWFGRTPS